MGVWRFVDEFGSQKSHSKVCFGASQFLVLPLGICQVQSESAKPHESQIHTTITKNVNYEIWRSPFRLLLYWKRKIDLLQTVLASHLVLGSEHNQALGGDVQTLFGK